MRIKAISAAHVVILSLMASSAGAQNPSDIVKWSATCRPQSVKAGQNLTASLQAKIEDGWHVYSITQPPGGPTATEVSVPNGQPFKQVGNVTQPKPESAYDPNFSMNTEFYEDQVSFSVPLAVDASAKTGEMKGTIDVRFQACNERFCLPAVKAHVPLSLNVTVAGSKPMQKH